MSVNGREFESFIYKETVLLDPGVLVNCYSVSSPFLLGEEAESKVVTQSVALNCYLWSSAFLGGCGVGPREGGEFSIRTGSRSPRAPASRPLFLQVILTLVVGCTLLPSTVT